MVLVVESNFQTEYAEIEKTLKDASFIAIDAEYSGFQCENVPNESLFDSPKDRYQKLRRQVQPFIIVQFGLTAFVRVHNENTYKSHSFDFYLMPKALPMKNRSFLVQASSLQFLACYNFDFNKLAYSSLSYLDKSEKAALSKSLKNGTLLQEFGNLISIENQIEIDECILKVEKWLKEDDQPGELPFSTSSFTVCYFMQKKLREKFKEIWTEWIKATKFVVGKAKEIEEESQEAGGLDDLDEGLIDYYTGFSKVFELIVQMKKPIVGHNLLMDLMFMYQQFVKPLPGSYETFKQDVHNLFPIVYDTKFVSYEIKRNIKNVTWKSNVLGNLYTYFNDGPGRYVALNTPRIFPPGNDTDSNQCLVKVHDAAWDSYYTGFCFIKMAHIFTSNKLGRCGDFRVLTNKEIMSSVECLANRVNLVRADSSCVRLDGPDPLSTRPRWLIIEVLKKSVTMDELVQSLSCYEVMDVKELSCNEILVAAPNHYTARNIIEKYNKQGHRVIPYNPIKHSQVARGIYGCLALTALFFVARWTINDIRGAR